MLVACGKEQGEQVRVSMHFDDPSRGTWVWGSQLVMKAFAAHTMMVIVALRHINRMRI